MAVLRLQPAINIRPIPVSKAASKMIDILSGISPKLSISMVRIARSSAGLRLGKNFKNPKKKYTNPMVRLSRLNFNGRKFLMITSLFKVAKYRNTLEN